MAFLDGLEFLNDLLDAVGAEADVDAAFLLSASISADYPLDAALRMARRGIVNTYNPGDHLLKEGTGALGNVDGRHGDSAGRTGFRRSYQKLYQREITNERVAREFGSAGAAHFAVTKADLIKKYAPAWLLSKTWPPPGRE